MSKIEKRTMEERLAADLGRDWQASQVIESELAYVLGVYGVEIMRNGRIYVHESDKSEDHGYYLPDLTISALANIAKWWPRKRV